MRSRLRGARTPDEGGSSAGQDLQERGLARAVRTHEADVVAVEDAEGEAFEERRRAEGLGELLAGKKEVAHACTPGASWPVRSTYST